jgi:hypothetical protein
MVTPWQMVTFFSKTWEGRRVWQGGLKSDPKGSVAEVAF